MKKRILFSASASPAAISLIQHVKSLGYWVIGMDANPELIQVGEEICDEFWLSPMALSDGYLPFLEEKSKSFDLFFPFIDEEIVQLCSCPISTALKSRVAISDNKTSMVCLDKVIFQQFCDENFIRM